MDIEKLITETFVEHEHVVPDDAAVLAAVRRRIDRGHRALRLPLVVAAGVMTVTLTAASVVVWQQVRVPEDGARTATPVSRAAIDPAITGVTMPFDLGWLPPGEVEHRVHRVNVGAVAAAPDVPLYGGEYMLRVTGDGQVYDVDVHQLRGISVDEAAFKSGGGNPVTVGGLRGVESAHTGTAAGYELYVARPGGGSVYVNVIAHPGSTRPGTRPADVGRRIAENVRFPGTTAIPPAFGLRDLPGGMRVCAFDVEVTSAGSRHGSKAGTHYSLGTCDTGTSIDVGTNPDAPEGTTGWPVQGHKTSHVDENGYRSLWVRGAVGDQSVVIAGRVPLRDLYEVGESLVLPR